MPLPFGLRKRAPFPLAMVILLALTLIIGPRMVEEEAETAPENSTETTEVTNPGSCVYAERPEWSTPGRWVEIYNPMFPGNGQWGVAVDQVPPAIWDWTTPTPDIYDVNEVSSFPEREGMDGSDALWVWKCREGEWQLYGEFPLPLIANSQTQVVIKIRGLQVRIPPTDSRYDLNWWWYPVYYDHVTPFSAILARHHVDATYLEQVFSFYEEEGRP